MDSALARIRNLKRGKDEEPARMGLFENTIAAVAAQLSRMPLDGPWLQVELRERAGRQPALVLKQASKPLAVLVDNLLLVSNTAPRCIRLPLIREARARALDYEDVYDRQLTSFASYEAVSAGSAALDAQCASASGGVSRR